MSSIEKCMRSPVRLNQGEIIKNYEDRYKSLIKSANNTSESMPSRLKNKVYSALSRFAESIKSIIINRLKSAPIEKTFVSHIGGVGNNGVDKCGIDTPEIGKAVNDERLAKNVEMHFDKLLKEKPDVLLVLASDNMFLENKFLAYFNQPTMHDYHGYSVSSFPCSSGDKKIDSLEIDNRMVFIAKNNESVAIRVAHVTNWSDMNIATESWNKLSDYTDKIGNERAKLRGNIGQMNKPVAHNGVAILQFGTEFNALYSKENKLPHAP